MEISVLKPSGEVDLEGALAAYEEKKVTYADLRDYEDRIYQTKDGIGISEREFAETVEKLNDIAGPVFRKSIWHLVKNDHAGLRKIGFTERMIEVMQHALASTGATSPDTLEFGWIGRFDLIIDEIGNPKIVEINSETPAGIPDAATSDIHDRFIMRRPETFDTNRYFVENAADTIHKAVDMLPVKKERLLVVFSDDGTEISDDLTKRIIDIGDRLAEYSLSYRVVQSGDYLESERVNNQFSINLIEQSVRVEEIIKELSEINYLLSDGGIQLFLKEGVVKSQIEQLIFTDGEDYCNALHLSKIISDATTDFGIDVGMGRMSDIETRDDGIYHNGIKQDIIWSFYPLEWIFLDQGGEEFWKLYIDGKFSIANSPLTLIPQSKGFWAYLFENIDNMGLTEREKSTIDELVPRYTFEKPRDRQTVNKPLFYREGVGIDDPSYVGAQVYQDRVVQKKYEIETFEGVKTGYLTLGVYVGQFGYVGTFNRFCENPITDSTAYTIQSYISSDIAFRPLDEEEAEIMSAIENGNLQRSKTTETDKAFLEAAANKISSGIN